MSTLLASAAVLAAEAEDGPNLLVRGVPVLLIVGIIALVVVLRRR